MKPATLKSCPCPSTSDTVDAAGVPLDEFDRALFNDIAKGLRDGGACTDAALGLALLDPLVGDRPQAPIAGADGARRHGHGRDEKAINCDSLRRH